jgi:hypothetical protein
MPYMDTDSQSEASTNLRLSNASTLSLLTRSRPTDLNHMSSDHASLVSERVISMG